MDIQTVKEQLNEFGYCVVENVMPVEEADRMAQHYFNLHEQHFPKDQGYQSLQGLLNHDKMCWPWVLQPEILELARYYLGPRMRFAEAGSKWVKPGCPVGGVHADSLGLPEPFPVYMWLFQTMWMLTDFTEENGGTLVVPFSHRLGCNPNRNAPSDRSLIPAVGQRGDVLLWHGGLWHAFGGNTSRDQHRMGLNLAYIPFWLNDAVGGWPPVLPEVFAQMPQALQELNRHRVAKH